MTCPMRRLTLLTLLLALSSPVAQAQAPEAPAPDAPRDAAPDVDADTAPPEGPDTDAPPAADAPPAETPPEGTEEEDDAPIDWGALSEELAEEEAEPREEGSEDDEASEDDGAGDEEEEDDEDDDWVLDAYEVRAPIDPFRTGGSVQQLSEETLDAYDYDDVNSALQQVPGVYVRQEEGFGLRPNIGLRGTTSDRSRKVTLMEDGVLFGPAPYSAPAAYYFPIFSRIVGVDVYKGPAAVLFGPNTIGGAINLRTREVPTTPEGRFELSYGRFQYRRTHFYYGGSSRHAGILFEGVHLGTNGFRDIDAGDPDTGFNRSEFMLRSFVQTTPGEPIFNRVELKLGFSRERSNETYLGLSDEDFRDNPYRRYAASQLDRMTWWRTQVELRHHLVIGEHVDFVTTAYRHDFQRTWRRLNRFVGERDGTGPSLFDTLNNPSGGRDTYYRVLSGERDSTEFGPEHDLLVVSNARRFVSQGVQTELHATFGEAVEQELIVGLRLHYDEIDRNHVERAYSLIAQQLVANGDDPSTITLNEGSATALAGHAAYSLSYRGLTVKPGIRIESIRATLRDQLAAGGPRSSTQTYLVVLPGLGATYELTEHVAALVGVHRGFSPLAPGAGDDVEMETSIAYEAGAAGPTRRARPERRADRVRERLSAVRDPVRWQRRLRRDGPRPAVQRGRRADRRRRAAGGLRAGPRARPHAAHAPLLHVHARHVPHGVLGVGRPPAGQRARRSDPVPYVPEHQWSLQLGLHHEDWAVNASGTYVSAMPEVADNSVRTEGYLIVDVTGSYTVLERFDVTLRLENLTNAQPLVSRRPFGARGYRPFMVQVGVEVPL
jgi:Fe(3+) dicitrate transport protein